jgi:hypothetical protein
MLQAILSLIMIVPSKLGIAMPDLDTLALAYLALIVSRSNCTSIGYVSFWSIALATLVIVVLTLASSMSY